MGGPAAVRPPARWPAPAPRRPPAFQWRPPSARPANPAACPTPSQTPSWPRQTATAPRPAGWLADWPQIQQQHAGQTRGNAKPLARRGALAKHLRTSRGEQRHGGHRQRRHARGHPLLGHRHPAIAASQQQGANRARVQPLPPAGRRRAAPTLPGVQQPAGQQKADCRHHQRRPAGHANADGQIGGAQITYSAANAASKRQRAAGNSNKHGRSFSQGGAFASVTQTYKKSKYCKSPPCAINTTNPACGRVLIYKMGFLPPAAKESKADGTG